MFRRRRFFNGRPVHHIGEQLRDIAWFTPSGDEMTEQDWDTGYARSMAVFLNGDAIPSPDPRGQKVKDDSFLLLFNAADTSIGFTLPSSDYGERWEIVVDTTSPLDIDRPSLKAEGTVDVEARAVLVLRRAL